MMPIMDILKTEAPFWKTEGVPHGIQRWVDARESGCKAASHWEIVGF